MVVVDASVIVDLILDMPPQASQIGHRLREQAVVAAPHVIDAEVASILRGRVLRGKLPSAGARAALADFVALPIDRYPHTGLLARALELRDNATIYDALYLALAEILQAPLLTRDGRLARVPGVTAHVEVVGDRA